MISALPKLLLYLMQVLFLKIYRIPRIASEKLVLKAANRILAAMNLQYQRLLIRFNVLLKSVATQQMAK